MEGKHDPGQGNQYTRCDTHATNGTGNCPKT